MNLNKNFKRNGLVIALTLAISACSILPDMSDIPFIGSNKAEEETQDLQPINFFGGDSESFVEELSEEARVAQELRSEWEAVRPSINRLIELESDLSFLIDQLNQSATGPDFTSTPNDRQFVVNDGTEKFDTAIPTEQALLDLGQSSVQVQPVRSLTVNSGGVNQQKFNGSFEEQTSNVSSLPPVQTAKQEVNDNKFSGLASNSPFSAVNSGTCPTIGNGEGFSMHIASFKQRDKARSLLSEYKNRLMQGKPCGNTAMIAEVEVNGEVFFSARLGVFVSKEEALAACNAVKNIQSYCAVTRNQGVPLV